MWVFKGNQGGQHLQGRPWRGPKNHQLKVNMTLFTLETLREVAISILAHGLTALLLWLWRGKLRS